MALRALQGPTGGGSPVGGSGTPGTIPVWSSGTTLGDSPLTVSGTTVTAAQAFTVNGTQTFNGNLVSGFNQTWTLNGGFLNIQSGLLYLDKTNSRIGIGTASPVSRLDVAGTITCDDAGTGLKLPATPGNADTQTLDCYEENTWVPTLSGFGGTAPTVQTARYTRIGRMVVCNLVLVATGGNQFSASTGTPTYVTLPFTPATDGAAPVTNSGVAALGPGLIGTNARFYIPTFALTAATTSATIIFTV